MSLNLFKSVCRICLPYIIKIEASGNESDWLELYVTHSGITLEAEICQSNIVFSCDKLEEVTKVAFLCKNGWKATTYISNP